MIIRYIGLLSACGIVGMAFSGLQAAPAQDPFQLIKSTNTVSRRQAVLELATSKAPNAGPALLGALADKDAMVRTLAVRGLSGFQVPGTFEALDKLLKSDPAEDVRIEVANVFRTGREAQGADALAAALKDASAPVRIAALSGLAQYRRAADSKAASALLRDPSVEVRRTAVFTVGRLGDPSVAAALKEALKDKDASVRAGSAQALGELHVKEALPALKTLLAEPDAAIRVSAARSMLLMGDLSGLQAALTDARAGELNIRLIAIDALGWSAAPEAEAALSEMASGPTDMVRSAAQQALMRLKGLKKRK